jgi:hypothetical protein
MATERGRARRRAQADRAKGRSRRTWRVMAAQCEGQGLERASDPRWVGMRATTRTFATQEDRDFPPDRRQRSAALGEAEQLQEEGR